MSAPYAGQDRQLSPEKRRQIGAAALGGLIGLMFGPLLLLCLADGGPALVLLVSALMLGGGVAGARGKTDLARGTGATLLWTWGFGALLAVALLSALQHHQW